MGKYVDLKTDLDFEAMKRTALDRLERETQRAVSDETTALIMRTRRGVDVEGRGFAPYSESYADYKAEKGRNRTPDLTFTGKMLAAITHRIERRATELLGEVFFNSTAEAQKARFNQATRRFFGFSKEQVGRIVERLQKVINGN